MDDVLTGKESREKWEWSEGGCAVSLFRVRRREVNPHCIHCDT